MPILIFETGIETDELEGITAIETGIETFNTKFENYLFLFFYIDLLNIKLLASRDWNQDF